MRGHKVVYTPFSVGWSDSPVHIGHYIRQQTRWSKSWCREIWYTLFASRLHGLSGVYLAFECLYQITYFFLVMYLFSRLLIESNIRAQAATVLVSTAVALAKCAYFALRSRNITAFYFVLYTFVYFFCMIPARLTAAMTMWDVSWGTRGDNAGNKIWQFLKNFGVAYLWWACVLAGAVYSIVNNWYFDWSSVDYRFALVGICSYIVFLIIMLLIYFVGSITRFNHTPLMKEITKERNAEQMPQP
jgi:hyaluronan synthase